MIESGLGIFSDRQTPSPQDLGKKRRFNLSEEDLSQSDSTNKKLRSDNDFDHLLGRVTEEDNTPIENKNTKPGIFQRLSVWLSSLMTTEEVITVESRRIPDQNRSTMADFQCRNYSENENINGSCSSSANIFLKRDHDEIHLGRQKSGVPEKYNSAIKISRPGKTLFDNDSFQFETPRPSAIREKSLLTYPSERKFSFENEGDSFKFQPTVSSTVSRQSPIRKKYLLREAYPTTSERKLSGLSSQSFAIFKPMIRRTNISKSRYFTNNGAATATASFLRGVTAHESFKLEEKQRYKSLLQNFTSSVIQTSGNLTRKYLHRPAGDLMAFEKAQRAGAIMKECFDSFWGGEKKSDIEKAETVSISSSTKSRQSKSHSKIFEVIDLDSDEDEKTALEKEDDDIQITKEILKTSPIKNSLEERLRTSPFYTGDHFKERKEHFEWRIERQNKAAEAALEKTRRLEHLRQKHDNSLEDKIARRLAQLELTFPTKVIEVSSVLEESLPELTKPIMATIFRALKGGPLSEVVADKFSIRVTRKDIHTLVGLNWLNDEVINFYMNLIMDRNQDLKLTKIYAFNTFFYPKLVKTGYGSVRRWTKKVDLFNYELLIVPVHLGVHWCLATIDFRDRTVRYYDSMHGDNYRCLQELLTYLNSEHSDKKKADYDTSNWKLDNIKDIPQQMNGSDCGMFSCKFAEYVSRGSSITFSQEHMPYFRQRMIYEICSMKLM